MDMNERIRERGRLLRELAQVKKELASALDEQSAASDSADSAVASSPFSGDFMPFLKSCRELEQAYLALLPKVAVSRCPFTGEIVRKTIDTLGLDGVWWDYENPVRPGEDPGPTYLGMSGSLRITQPLPVNDFSVMPGPSTPCILPGLLSMPHVRAVLSSVQVGGNPGVAVTWFVSRDRHLTLPPNEWGAPWCDAYDVTGQDHRGPSPFILPDYDTDLAPWIQRGKLLWIAPGDDSLLLRADLGACPYLGMEGNGLLQHVLAGHLEAFGMTDADIRQDSMTPEAFETAMKRLKDDGVEEE